MARSTPRRVHVDVDGAARSEIAGLVGDGMARSGGCVARKNATMSASPVGAWPNAPRNRSSHSSYRSSGTSTRRSESGRVDVMSRRLGRAMSTPHRLLPRPE